MFFLWWLFLLLFYFLMFFAAKKNVSLAELGKKTRKAMTRTQERNAFWENRTERICAQLILQLLVVVVLFCVRVFFISLAHSLSLWVFFSPTKQSWLTLFFLFWLRASLFLFLYPFLCRRKNLSKTFFKDKTWWRWMYDDFFMSQRRYLESAATMSDDSPRSRCS